MNKNDNRIVFAENAVDETRKPNPARSYAELLYGRDWRVKAGIVAAGGEGQQKKPSPKTPYKENLSLKEACLQLGFMSEEEFDRVFHPEELV